MPKSELFLVVFLKFFLLLRNFLDLIFQTRKEKMMLTFSSLMMDFSIHSHFIKFPNYASEESEDEISLNLLGSMLTFASFCRNSIQTRIIKEENKDLKNISQTRYKKT